MFETIKGKEGTKVGLNVEKGLTSEKYKVSDKFDVKRVEIWKCLNWVLRYDVYTLCFYSAIECVI